MVNRMEFSDWLPNLGSVADDLLMVRSLHSEEFNHHPGQLMMQCGVSRFGMPAMGSWINYGLDGRSITFPVMWCSPQAGGAVAVQHFIKAVSYPPRMVGFLFRNQGEPVLNLANPAGLPRNCKSWA